MFHRISKQEVQSSFLTDFEVFGYLPKQLVDYEMYDTASQTIIILGEIQTKSSQNSKLIKTRHPNHRHDSDFLCFLFNEFEKHYHITTLYYYNFRHNCLQCELFISRHQRKRILNYFLCLFCNFQSC